MTFTALVMAASRAGVADPVAQARGVTQKCMATVGGVPMLTRVLRTLRASPSVGAIYVSIEDADLLAHAPDGALGVAVPSQPRLADSVIAAVRAMPPAPWPLLITTADNALMTAAMIEAFCAASRASGADVTLAMTPAATLLAAYPGGQRAFHRFRDGAASGCNLYALMNDRGLAAAQAFAGGGQFGKRPWRIVRAFGLATFVLHMLRRLTLEHAVARIGRGFGLEARAVQLDFPEAAIDIDTLADLALAEEIIRARDQGATRATDK